MIPLIAPQFQKQIAEFGNPVHGDRGVKQSQFLWTRSVPVSRSGSLTCPKKMDKRVFVGLFAPVFESGV
jgi:hypothetical protein